MLDKLKNIVNGSECWTEIRYHLRNSTNIRIRNGKVEKSEYDTLAGAGIRCLVDGCWGFVATSDTDADSLNNAVKEAEQAAARGARLRQNKIEGLGEGEIARGKYYYVEDSDEPNLKEKIELFLKTEAGIREKDNIVSGDINYSQYDEEKYIVNSDGAAAHIKETKRDIGVIAFARNHSGREMGTSSAGVTGSWEDLFADKILPEMVEEATGIARQNLEADYAPGGEYTVILDPMLVGVLAHEAIGHTVEADFVLSGSIVKDKIGEKVASKLITMVDDGSVEGAAGMVMVDDEGIETEKTVIIEDGVLKNYLHNRESAYLFATKARGNARAFTYRDEPIIRMTNTSILPGEDNLDGMIAGIEDGFFLKGLGQSGQADATAEFMFGVEEAYRIKDGKVAEPVKGITISGQAFKVLSSVDAVSRDFKFALGRGYCGKGQPAKVDAGGPYLRCRVTIGGQQ
ncbi:MAG: TldD/PmbA family protein [Halanaerobiales bacterium]